MAIKDSNTTIMVKDMDRSVSFYEALGLTTKNRWGNHYAQLNAPGIIIGLHPTAAENVRSDSGNVSIGFSFDDLFGSKVNSKQAFNRSNRTRRGRWSIFAFRRPGWHSTVLYQAKMVIADKYLMAGYSVFPP